MSKVPDAENLGLVRQALESQVRLLFLNRDGGAYNPEKYRSVAKQTEESIDLFLKAQAAPLDREQECFVASLKSLSAPQDQSISCSPS